MLKGYDLSNWQSVGAGDSAADFVICKATESTNYVDPKCDQHYQRAKAQGKLLGVYHFAQPSASSAEAQAEFFVNNIKGYIGEAILVLDWEVNTSNVSWAKAWLGKVYQLTGVRPLIYMSASVVNSNNWSSVAKDYGLWIAGYPNAYNVPNPPTPSVNDMPYGIGAWSFWAIWQYSSSAGRLDLDIANMNRAAWKKYANPKGGSKPAPAPTPAPAPKPAKKTNEQLADEVIRGDWGNGEERKRRLTEAGYDYNAVQAIVDARLAPKVVYYRVRQGDTLSGIAAKYGTTWQKIAADNNIANPNLIYPSQTLAIKL